MDGVDPAPRRTLRPLGVTREPRGFFLVMRQGVHRTRQAPSRIGAVTHMIVHNGVLFTHRARRPPTGAGGGAR
eukprot:scaffold133213_cov60-Phaeocystis_antarctica.AAC.1